ncbi:hypothetical protein FQA39_LY17502 [Lamprigera yunnana]|nr:hypothetical protein FQA39_LY17502 [Lamprigera yunnana]
MVGKIVGPTWIPLLGSLNCLRSYSVKYGGQQYGLHELSKKWNSSILGFKMGQEIVVVVEDFQTIKEILMSEDYDQRPKNFFTNIRTLGTFKGITCAEGKLWEEHRKFTIKHLRHIGLGKNIMDLKINEEIQNLFKTIEAQEVVQISHHLPFTIFNILWVLIAGSRISSETFQRNQLLNIMTKRTKAFDMCGGILTPCPWLRHIIPDKSGYNVIKKLNKEVKTFLLETINEHHGTWEAGNKDDFIYSFISEMKNQNENTTTFTDEQLLLVCLDLFVGGFTTTSCTLDFVVLLMLLNQDIQTKAHEILDTTFDKTYAIEYQDRYKVPFIQAVINEAQRFRNVAPILGPRRVTKDTSLAGYSIPKNTTVLINLHPTLMSKEIWGDPENFRPARFLNDHDELITYPEFIPFGLGKRKCLADIFARGCLFVITCEILRNYIILPVDSNNLPSAKPVPGLITTPQPYFAKFVIKTLYTISP